MAPLATNKYLAIALSANEWIDRIRVMMGKGIGRMSAQGHYRRSRLSAVDL